MSKNRSMIDQAAAGLLADLPLSTYRDQNAAIIRDRLGDFGLDGTDPATQRGALAGILIIREQLQIVYGIAGDRGLLLVPGGDLFNIPQVLCGMEGLAAMIDTHRRAGR
jgi:hypothetical protein